MSHERVPCNPPSPHTHTHTCMRAHVHTHMNIHMHTPMHTHVHTYISIRTCTHMCTYTHTCIHLPTIKYTTCGSSWHEDTCLQAHTWPSAVLNSSRNISEMSPEWGHISLSLSLPLSFLPSSLSMHACNQKPAMQLIPRDWAWFCCSWKIPNYLPFRCRCDKHLIRASSSGWNGSGESVQLGSK